MAHSPPDSRFFGRPQMTSPARIEDLSKAMGDVNEVVAAIAIASTLDQDEALHRSEMEAGKAVLPLLGEPANLTGVVESACPSHHCRRDWAADSYSSCNGRAKRQTWISAPRN
jgi:hypothetical protein